MDIPSKIRIGGVDYAVERLERPTREGQEVFGDIDFYTAAIRLNDDVPVQLREETLIHELLHGIVHHYNVPIKEDDEEMIIEALAKGLHQVLSEENIQIANRSVPVIEFLAQ